MPGFGSFEFWVFAFTSLGFVGLILDILVGLGLGFRPGRKKVHRVEFEGCSKFRQRVH